MKKRLRKTLRVREFQEMGFHVDFELEIPFIPAVKNAFFNKLISFVEARQLEIGGSLSSFYTTRAGRGTTTEADREALAAWLHQQPEVSAIKLWPLGDAWHGPFAWL